MIDKSAHRFHICDFQDMVYYIPVLIHMSNLIVRSSSYFNLGEVPGPYRIFCRNVYFDLFSLSLFIAKK